MATARAGNVVGTHAEKIAVGLRAFNQPNWQQSAGEQLLAELLKQLSNTRMLFPKRIRAQNTKQ